MMAAIQRYEDDAEAAVTAVRSVRRRELLRTSAEDTLGGDDAPQTSPASLPGGADAPGPPIGRGARPPIPPGPPGTGGRLAATSEALTDITRASLQAALEVALRKVSAELRRAVPTRFAVIAMGRFR